MRPGTSTWDVLGVPRDSVPAGTAHTRPSSASAAHWLPQPESCGSAVATARARHTRRHDNFDTLTTSSVKVRKLPAASMGPQAFSLGTSRVWFEHRGTLAVSVLLAPRGNGVCAGRCQGECF